MHATSLLGGGLGAEQHLHAGGGGGDLYFGQNLGLCSSSQKWCWVVAVLCSSSQNGLTESHSHPAGIPEMDQRFHKDFDVLASETIYPLKKSALNTYIFGA